MAGTSDTPTLSSWAGGTEAFNRLFERFYQRVAQNAVLAPVFAGMDPLHARHVASFVSEVLGGDKAYSALGQSHAGMIMRHMDRKLTHAQRKAWVALLLETADEVGMPDDPEFRASFVGYLEWGSRLAVINSQVGAEAPKADLPMPDWNWSSPGGPYRP
jgi:hemoglobin